MIDHPKTFPLWLVVVSQGGKALGVFGSALSREAQQCATRVQVDTGFAAWIVTVRGARPSVGDPMPNHEPERENLA